MKIKIGTQLEEAVYHDLKVEAARERRAIGEVIQEAIATYLHRKAHSCNNTGLSRFLEPDPLALTDRQLHNSMESDFFDQ